jgi:hypothetical protein
MHAHEEAQRSPFREGAIQSHSGAHCLRSTMRDGPLVCFCTLQENFLPIEKDEGLVTVLMSGYTHVNVSAETINHDELTTISEK